MKAWQKTLLVPWIVLTIVVASSYVEDATRVFLEGHHAKGVFFALVVIAQVFHAIDCSLRLLKSLRRPVVFRIKAVDHVNKVVTVDREPPGDAGRRWRIGS